MKKLITGLLATTMCLSLCACRSAEEGVLRAKEVQEDIAAAQPITELTEIPTTLAETLPETTEEITEAEATEETIIFTGEDIVEGVEALVSNPLYPRLKELMGFELTDHDIMYASSSNEHVSAMFSQHQLIVPEYTFEMDDGSRLQLPMTYQDLCDSGWKSEYNMEDEAPTDAFPGDEYMWFSFINPDGKTISAEIGNYSASPVALSNTTVTQLQVGSENAEGCCVNGIRTGATVKEVLDKFGIPFECSYYKWEDGHEHFSFYYIDEINYSHISFDFNPATGLLESINYCVLLHPDDRPA